VVLTAMMIDHWFTPPQGEEPSDPLTAAQILVIAALTSWLPIGLLVYWLRS
jgi:membrane protein insertase Oxa1/YidC/SpoIIIJ